MTNYAGNEACVLIMAGGTGGHVFPGLAAAASLQARGLKVEWLGTRKGIEAELVPANGIPISYIKVAGVRGKGFVQLLLAPLQVMRALFEAMQIIRRIKPVCVLGMGGFASGPGGLAAWLLRKPLVIHEQNAVAGTTNRILAMIADRVLAAFPGAFKGKDKKVLVLGNPVRDVIAALPAPHERGTAQHSPLRLLVLGGSLGAKAINDLIPEVLQQLAEDLPAERMPEVWHQTGKNHCEKVMAEYKQSGYSVKAEPFIANMAAAYAWADLVICRAGALTVSEIAAAGVTAIFIPYPFAIDDHQTSNAQWLVSQGAGYLLPQADINVTKLAELIVQLDTDRAGLLNMAQSARAQAKTDAAERVADQCLEAAYA
jgi:UDP-N-acetylglucosamine--N-acetylmuramyl-(pentapeptide) pyrophosphoryl-undecaprenol N-acetylglucosamine transferase